MLNRQLPVEGFYHFQLSWRIDFTHDSNVINNFYNYPPKKENNLETAKYESYNFKV